jgi:hypothetical protein
MIQRSPVITFDFGMGVAPAELAEDSERLGVRALEGPDLSCS